MQDILLKEKERWRVCYFYLHLKMEKMGEKAIKKRMRMPRGSLLVIRTGAVDDEGENRLEVIWMNLDSFNILCSKYLSQNNVNINVIKTKLNN